MAIENIADWIAGKTVGDEKFRAKVAETVDLYGLTEHQGWEALKRHFGNGSESFHKSLAHRLLGGEQVNQREIDYLRGCMDIAQAIFTYPERALADLEASARRGWAAHLAEEAASSVESESLYLK